MTSNPGILYGWKAISQFIGCSTATAKKYFKRRHLPVKKIDGRVIISTAMVENWVERWGMDNTKVSKS